ncbi:MAG: bifunctional oligoribonuclease/PAP phosphatase NrnA [Clostridia bacterium]|nr:bifunctional oligoribonuclease/PAP phosphatase NrnA [Clostridia bacterium]
MTLKEIAEKFKSVKSALIFSHSRPDGDTLGSAFALKSALNKIGKRADIVCESPIPQKFSFFPISSEVKRTINAEDLNYDAHISVDCSVPNMMGENYSLYTKNKNTFNIDHHISNSEYAKYNYVEDRASCCEIMYSFISALGIEIDKEIANCILLGLSTDTGHFMHNNVTSETFDIASKLVAMGGDIHEIGYRMFKSQPKNRALLFVKVMSGMRFFLDGKLAIIHTFKDDLNEFNATSDLTEGFIDFPLSVDGVEVAISILENKENCYKISFRSKGKVNVNEIASTFGGGGHVLASGAMLNGFYEDVKDKLIHAVELNMGE